MARLGLTLLGGFRARLDDQALGITIKKSQALLAYLAVPLGQAHPRDKLATLLWGDMPEARARAGLRQTLFTLRKILGDPEPMRLVAETVALDPALVHADVHAFEQHVAEGTRTALQQASALCEGDLLEGLSLQEAPFEEWLLAERLRLRELAVEALAKLVAQHRDAGAVEDAVQAALRLVALDPLQESVHRTLMRLYTQLGRRAAALHQYQFCVAVLQRELRTEPDDETRALYQLVLQRRPAELLIAQAPRAAGSLTTERPEPSPEERPLAAESPFVGREVELGQLRDALVAALAGRGQLETVIGEAGVGKSRLVAEVVGEASRKGARVVFGRCYETERVLPFGPWINAMRGSHLLGDREMLDRLGPVWRGELAPLLPEIAPAPPAAATSDPAQLFEAVAQLLERVALGQPTVLVLEDLHWADEMSLRLLAFVSRRLERWRLLALVTIRDDDLVEASLLRHTLDELGQGRHTMRLALRSLSRTIAASARSTGA